MAGRKANRESLKFEKAVSKAQEAGLGSGELQISPKTTPNFSFVAYGFSKGYRYIALEGSSRSGKTYAALQWCVYACLSPKTFVKTYVKGELKAFEGEKLKIRCLRYDAVNARDSIWSDLNGIMAGAKLTSGTAGFVKNETKMTWTFPNGSQIICGGANDSGKLHGLEQDICYFNEAMMIPRSALDQLEYRTRVGFIFDWNPSLNDHWIFRGGFDRTSVYGADERLAGLPKCLYAHSTYKDNLENLTESQVAGIEKYEPTAGNIERGTADAYMWSVYGLGKRGFIEGRVISPEKVEILPEVVDALTGEVFDGFPNENQWELHGYGLDWGRVDPTALVECAIWNRKLYVRELVYERNLLVSPEPTLPGARNLIGLLQELKINPKETIVGDSARKDLNDALRMRGYTVVDAYKPGGSIDNGANLMNQRRWCVCERSRNVQFELENWTWAKDRYGNVQRKPIDKHNHAMDAVRYWLTTFVDTGNVLKMGRRADEERERRGEIEYADVIWTF